MRILTTPIIILWGYSTLHARPKENQMLQNAPRKDTAIRTGLKTEASRVQKSLNNQVDSVCKHESSRK